MLMTFQWLPNQLLSVYDQMLDVDCIWGGLFECMAIMDLVKSQRATLTKEVEKYFSEKGR